MESPKIYPIPKEFTKKAHINLKMYRQLYHQSIQQPSEFWEEQAKKFIYWSKSWDVIQAGDFSTSNPRWFVNAKLNACYNCVDRHLVSRADQVAIIWEGNNPHESKTITYQELYNQVTQFAEILKGLGVKKGHRVGIYLLMIPEAIMAMLACARLGAIHCVIFGGFSAEALSTRLQDASCSLLITADEGLRGDKVIPLKRNADLALQHCPQIQKVLVVRRTGNAIPWEDTRDHWYHEALRDAESNTTHADTVCVDMDANDPLFILYTSGSTGKPKGIVHSTGGYLLYTAMTHRYVFDYHEEDIYWCTADIGWITGHSYLVYGPLANGGTTLLFEGVPHYPNYARYWEIIDKHQVAIFYTAPTVIRALRREGDEWVKKSSRKSLKLLGSVGEPINPAAWEWYYGVVGERRCPIVNTWWQTETGGILLTQFPGATPLAPGSVGWPFFGILPEILNEKGVALAANQTGSLVIQKPWPGLMQNIYGDPQRYIDNYLKPFPGKFLTGDGAYYNAEHDFWITGRNDDVLNVSGHRIGTEEIESALVSHPAVSEAAVVGIPNPLTGEGIYAFVTTALSIETSESLKQELIAQVREKIGPFARPEVIQWAAALPKTRSGKIMRRLLRKIAQNEVDDLGDTSTLADAGVVEQLIQGRA